MANVDSICSMYVQRFIMIITFNNNIVSISEISPQFSDFLARKIVHRVEQDHTKRKLHLKNVHLAQLVGL